MATLKRKTTFLRFAARCGYLAKFFRSKSMSVIRTSSELCPSGEGCTLLSILSSLPTDSNVSVVLVDSAETFVHSSH